MGRVIILNEKQLRKYTTYLAEQITFDEVTEEAEKADKEPSEGRKIAGNYKMGHVTINGFKITIENAKGSFRKYKDENGKEGQTEMQNHYGYFSNTEGRDGDHVDVFIGENLDFEKVFVVDQNKPDGTFDESKVMLGFTSKEEAKKAYESNFDKDWKGFREITSVSVPLFKKWLYRKHKQRKPFADYIEIIKKKEK
jgi:hypothetical protein